MIRIKDMTVDELCTYFASIGQPSYRAKQVFRWLSTGVSSFDEMSNLPKSLREYLTEHCFLGKIEVVDRAESSLDGTVKFLFRLDDGACVESVVMKYHHGYSICVSTQVGCRMGCKFCASTIGGLSRNLTAGEILDQVIGAQRELGIRISNIVMMGIGEPLDNYDNVLSFLKNVNHPDGLNIGYRHISLSTCGLVDKIRELAEENLPITLSISIHAPNNAIRDELMPINQRYPIEQLLDACRFYCDKTGRRITFEYSMIRGKNDLTKHAEELAKRLRGMLCHVNLIPVNPVTERSFDRSAAEQIKAFQATLERLGIPTTVRRHLGGDIDASCGQLRRKHQEL